MARSSQESSSQQPCWPLRTRIQVVVSACLAFGVPFFYLGFLVVAAWLLVTGSLRAFERWILEPGWSGVHLANSAVLSAGFVTWVWFFRPFWLKPRKPGNALQLLANDQPELFETVAVAVAQVRAPLPVAVCLDSGSEMRLEAAGVAGALLGGRHRLILGAAWIGVCNKGQLVADLAACLAQSPRGLAGRCYWVLRGVTDWLERAALQARRAGVTPPDVCEVVAGRGFSRKRKKKAWWQQPLLLSIKAGYLWLTRLPVWLMLQLARLVTRPALRRVMFACDAAGARSLGSAGYAELLKRKAGMAGIEARMAKRLEEGLREGRLPDNLPQARIREMERAGAAADASALPAGSARLQRVLLNNTQALITGGNSGINMVRRFFDISRHLTQMHYQQDLGLALGQFRLVAAGEAAKKNAENDATHFDIQRYFDGLAHPHRPLCGLEAEGQGCPTLDEMKQQIKASRQHMHDCTTQTRSLQKEWMLAWQCCRDMEMGHAMALAGMPLDARQYGLTAHDTRQYREEIARQEILMELADEALREIEAGFERRLAAALGLLMQSPRELVSVELQSLSGELPLWGAAYGELCSRLPVLWRLANRVSAFESLGLSAEDEIVEPEAGSDELSSTRRALDYLLPLIRQDMHQATVGLQALPCPLKPEVSMLAWLLEGHNTAALGPEPGLADGCLAVVFTERLMHLHQSVFAWLCRAAEASEKALLQEQVEIVGSRRLPELRLGCDFQETGDIPACVPAAAS